MTSAEDIVKQIYGFIEGNSRELIIESFGYFLDDYVIQGAEVSIDPRIPRRFVISEAIISFGDGLYRVFSDTVNLREGGTYFVDFTVKNGFVVNKVHPTDPYLPLWQINTDVNGNITSTVDLRGEMGHVRFKAEIQGIITDQLIVDEAHITPGAVGTTRIKDQAVTGEKIANAAIRNRHLSPEVASRLDNAEKQLKDHDLQLTEQNDRINNIVADAGSSNTEIVDARKPAVGPAFPVLRDRLNFIDSRLDDMTIMKPESESATLGNELVSPNGWSLGSGWSGDFASGFTHATGYTEPLTYPLGATAWKFYEITLTVESTDADHGFKFRVSIGNSYPFEMYEGAGTTITYSRGIQAVEDGDLRIIPESNFTGTIKNISVREIIGSISPTTIIRDQNGASVYEVRPTKADRDNIYIGKNAGRWNTSGRRNTIIGHESMVNNTSGYFNSALGFWALEKNTVGSRNIAIGYNALRDNISGHRNVGIGTFALNRNTHGHNNVAIGADALWYNKTGNYNVAIGLTAQEFNESGVGNIAIGYRSLLENKMNNFMVAIGHNAGKKLKSDNSIAIGSWSMENTTTGRENTAIGGYALRSNETGEFNVAIGAFAGASSKGHRNVFIGRSAGSGLENGHDNIFIGNGAAAPASSMSLFLNIGNSYYGDMGNKTFGIGVEQPTAKLHIGASTEARPSIKLTASPLTVTKHAGGIEYDGENLYITFDNGQRHKILTEFFN